MLVSRNADCEDTAFEAFRPLLHVQDEAGSGKLRPRKVLHTAPSMLLPSQEFAGKLGASVMSKVFAARALT